MHGQLRGQRVSQRVAGAEPLLEGHRAEGRGLQHAAACIHVGPLVNRSLQTALNEADAFEGDGVCHRVVGSRQVCLDTVGQGIESGGCSDGRGQ